MCVSASVYHSSFRPSATMAFNLQLFNVLVLGFSFMLVFTAFQTNGIIEQTIIKSIHADDPTFNGDGYTSLAIIYAAFAIANWATPSIVSLVGNKIAMLAGAVSYGLFIASFLHPITWLLYVASAVVGIGAACIWTGQGSFLTENSDGDTIARNSGIFWALLQCSLLFGNLFVYIKFQGQTHINRDTRFMVFIVLLVVACIGILLMLTLRRPPNDGGNERESRNAQSGAVDAFVRSIRLLFTRDMMLLSVSFFFTGLELSFFSGVYGSAIGFTLRIPESKQLLGLNGMLIGVGEILGGTAFGLLGKRTNRLGRDPVFLLGYVVHIASYFLIFINLPYSSPINDTTDPAFITPNAYLAMFCSFMLGFGDSCFNTQLYSMLGALYPDDSAPAFALFKFIQSVAAAVAFFYSNVLLLPWQLLILTITGTAGTLTFCLVEWRAYAEHRRKVQAAISDPIG